LTPTLGLLFVAALFQPVSPAVAGIPDYAPEPHPKGMLLWQATPPGEHRYLALIGNEQFPMLSLRGSVAEITKSEPPILLKPTGLKLRAKKVYLRGWAGKTNLARPTHGCHIGAIIVNGKLPLTLTGREAPKTYVDTEELGAVAVFFRKPMDFTDGIILGVTSEQYAKLRGLLGLEPQPATQAGPSPEAPAETSEE
jgi:hypothetical protein